MVGLIILGMRPPRVKGPRPQNAPGWLDRVLSPRGPDSTFSGRYTSGPEPNVCSDDWIMEFSPQGPKHLLGVGPPREKLLITINILLMSFSITNT